MNSVQVDARGLSCPLPALHAKQALGQVKDGKVEVLVDSVTSCDNVSRVGRKAGWAVAVEGQAAGGFKVVMTR